MITLPKSLKAFAATVDGVGYAGRLNDGQLPKLTTKDEDHRDGGMDGPVPLDMGMDKMESTYGFAEYDPKLMGLFGLIGVTKSVILTGSLEDEDGAIIPVVGEMRGRIKESDPGDWKSGGEKSALKLTHSLRYYKLTVDGAVVYEIDFVNSIRIIGGVDQLAARRGLLGI